MEGLLELPFWRLKPYVRPKPTRELKKRKTESLEQNKRRKIQKAERVKKFHEKVLNEVLLILAFMDLKHKFVQEVKVKYPPCVKCPANPRGQKCPFKLCRKCCEIRIKTEQIDCLGHKLLR